MGDLKDKNLVVRLDGATQERLVRLADRLGISQSGVIRMLINERWMNEPSAVGEAVEGGSQEAATDTVAQPR